MGKHMPWPAEAGRRPERHLRALLSCDSVSDELPFVVDGSRRPSRAMDDHLAACLRCQAELAGYRRLLKALHALRDQAAPGMATDLLGATLDRLHDHPSWPAGGHHARPGRVAWALAAAGLAALSAGAVMARAKQGRTAATLA